MTFTLTQWSIKQFKHTTPRCNHGYKKIKVLKYPWGRGGAGGGGTLLKKIENMQVKIEGAIFWLWGKNYTIIIFKIGWYVFWKPCYNKYSVCVNL
jgi:hypothetical protein